MLAGGTLVRIIWTVVSSDVDVIWVHYLTLLPVNHAADLFEASLNHVLRVLFWITILTYVFFILGETSRNWDIVTFNFILLGQSSSHDGLVGGVYVQSWSGALLWGQLFISSNHGLFTYRLLNCVSIILILHMCSLLQTLPWILVELATHVLSTISGLWYCCVLVFVLASALHVGDSFRLFIRRMWNGIDWFLLLLHWNVNFLLLMLQVLLFVVSKSLREKLIEIVCFFLLVLNHYWISELIQHGLFLMMPIAVDWLTYLVHVVVVSFMATSFIIVFHSVVDLSMHHLWLYRTNRLDMSGLVKGARSPSVGIYLLSAHVCLVYSLVEALLQMSKSHLKRSFKFNLFDLSLVFGQLVHWLWLYII